MEFSNEAGLWGYSSVVELRKEKSMPSVMVHAFNPGFLETDAGGSLSEFLTT